MKPSLEWRLRQQKFEQYRESKPVLALLYKKGFVFAHTYHDHLEEWRDRQNHFALYERKTDKIKTVFSKDKHLHRDGNNLERYL